MRLKKALHPILLTLLASQAAFADLAAPTIQSAEYSETSAPLITIQASDTNELPGKQYHAVLLTALTPSLRYANLLGGAEDGSMLSATSQNGSFGIAVSTSTRERYYAAVAVSGVAGEGADTTRIYSPWKVYTESSGAPKPISTAADTKEESPSYGAYYTKGVSEAVFYMTFSLANPDGHTLKISKGQGSTQNESVFDCANLSNPSGAGILVAESMDGAIEAAGIHSDIKNLVILSNIGRRNLYTIFCSIDDYQSGDLIKVSLKNTADTKIITEGTLSPATNEEILAMTGVLDSLMRVESGVDNPLAATSFPDYSNASQARLFAFATLQTSLAHASPKQNLYELERGIHTDYTQFMDNVCRNWSAGLNLGASDPGFARLDTLHGLMLLQNKDGIQDPLRITNNGVAAEFGTAQKLRKNYAFYEGYSRMDVDFDTVSYDENEHPGVGLMVRASDNIEIYAARADTNTMFDTAFIAGDGKTRYIFPATDSAVNNFRIEGEGIWVKGLDPEIDEKVWWVGLDAVRLPFTAGGDVAVSEAFSVGEKQLGGEPAGTLVGGPERSVLKIYELVGDNNVVLDTMKNARNPQVMLHGQQRRLEFDKDYLEADNIRFRIQAQHPDTGKMWLTDKTSYGATLVDTSTTANPLAINAEERTLLGELGYITTRILHAFFGSRKIAIRDAAGGRYNAAVTSPEVPFELAIESDAGKLLQPEDRGIGVLVELSGGIEVHNAAEPTANSRIWPSTEQQFYSGDSNEDAYRDFLSWDDFQEAVLQHEKLYITFKRGGQKEFFAFATVMEDGTVDKAEIAYFALGDLYEIDIAIPAPVDSLCYDYWIPNTQNGYNDKWEIAVSRNGIASKNTRIELGFEQGYENYNQGQRQPVFKDRNGNVIQFATTDGQGRIEGLRFGFMNGAGRVGDVYKIKARIAGREAWVGAKEKNYLAVYDKRMLDIAQTYCNNEAIADWTGRQCEADDPPIRDAVAYSFGGKDSREHFNHDMRDWMTVMNARTAAKAAVNDNMQGWKTATDGVYNGLFSDPPADDELFYDNMIVWRDALYAELDELYPNPDPAALFNDDMIEWRSSLDEVLEDFPAGPSPLNSDILNGMNEQLNESFAEAFPAEFPSEWNTTTAYGSDWLNYRIDVYGDLATADNIKTNCYRPRKSSAEWNIWHNAGNPDNHNYHPKRWAGIDCSGFVQRCAAGHTALPELGGRSEWNNYRVGDAKACSQLMHNQYSVLVGSPNQAQTFSRTVPGDIIIKNGHVAIINFISGMRGERIMDDIHLIQAIGGSDASPRGGRVTIGWRWSDNGFNGHAYTARRLVP